MICTPLENTLTLERLVNSILHLSYRQNVSGRFITQQWWLNSSDPGRDVVLSIQKH